MKGEENEGTNGKWKREKERGRGKDGGRQTRERKEDARRVEVKRGQRRSEEGKGH